MNDNINDLTKTIKQIYAWSEVTAQVICNYQCYSISEEYLNAIYKEFQPIYCGIRGDRSALLDDIIDILCGTLSILKPQNFELHIHKYRYGGDYI